MCKMFGGIETATGGGNIWAVKGKKHGMHCEA